MKLAAYMPANAFAKPPGGGGLRRGGGGLRDELDSSS